MHTTATLSRRTLRQLARVVCPPEIETHGILEDVVDIAVTSLAAFPPPVRLGLLTGLFGFELSSTLAVSARGRTFSRLDQEAAVAHFRRWWTSPLPPARLLANALKALLVLAHYEQEAVQDPLGYAPGRWIAEAAARRKATFGDELARRDAEVLARDPLPVVSQ